MTDDLSVAKEKIEALEAAAAKKGGPLKRLNPDQQRELDEQNKRKAYD